MTDAADDPVLGALARAIVERFAPERIVLFGSRARGDHHTDSDYDVMVVLDTTSHSADAVARAIHDVHTNVDVIVDTCEGFERRRTDVGTLEYVADREGRIVYTRTSVRDARVVRETPDTPPETPQSGAHRCRRPAAADARVDRLTAAPTAAVPRRPFAARALDLIG